MIEGHFQKVNMKVKKNEIYFLHIKKLKSVSRRFGFIFKENGLRFFNEHILI